MDLFWYQATCFFWNCGYIKISIPLFQDKCQNFFSTEALWWWFYIHHLTESQEHWNGIAMVIVSPISSCTSSFTWCPGIVNVLALGIQMPFSWSTYLLLPLLVLDLGMSTHLLRCSSNSNFSALCSYAELITDSLCSHTNLQKASDSIILYFY